MSWARYGNYCGPGWTASKEIDAKDANESDFLVPPVDNVDRICQYHDFHIWRAYQEYELHGNEAWLAAALKQADIVFVNDMYQVDQKGPLNELMSFLVWAGGPSFKLRGYYKGKSFINLQ